MSRCHILKTWPEPFNAVRQGVKTCEVRRNDRGYNVGDHLLLREYDPIHDEYSGWRIRAEITHILRGGQFGIENGYAVLSIAKIWTDYKP